MQSRRSIGPHVVDPRDVLVADALDAVAAEADAVERRALHGLEGHDRGRRGDARRRPSPAAIVPAEPIAETNAPTSSERECAASCAAAAVQWKWKR